jgi:hybrid cluster-associated redox disulfide protein
MEITKQTPINNLISKYPQSAGDFFNVGMMCIGCPMSQGETIQQGCQAHGFNEKQITKFIEDLNKKYNKNKKSPKKNTKKPVKKLVKKPIKKIIKKKVKKK